MSDNSAFLAAERTPPYYAVNFSWVPVPGYDEESQEAFAAEIYQRAATLPGFVGSEWIRDDNGRGIALAFWDSLEALERWTDAIADIVTRASGGAGGPRLFADYTVRVVKVERALRLSSAGPVPL